VTQLDTTVVFNVPSDEVRVAQADVLVSSLTTSNVQVSQADVVVVYKSRVEDPKVRAWTFTLDGHEFYVLSLGIRETLVYDVSTGEWYTWGTGEQQLWRAKIGINWTGTGALPGLYGSNVLVGDDSTGALYFLSPDADEDEDALEGATILRPFRRRLTAQYVIGAGYAAVPCFGVQAFGSIGETTVLQDLDKRGVTLEISDDRGDTWLDVGTLEPPLGDFAFRLNWQSLGVMQVPGRLFRLEDHGALKRIDDFELEDGE
jgi:hypothetical protein